jgi:putative ABC transport system permease protein
MRWFTQLQMRIKMLFNRKQAADSLDEELRFHLERQTAENMASGMNAEEARISAIRSFGNPALLRDQTRTAWSWTWLELLLRDVRFGVRTLVRAPGFAAIVILVMALGIGANVALFTIVRSVLLRPLPFTDPDRLVRLYEQSSDGTFPYNQSAAGIVAVWKRQSTSFSNMAMSSYAGYNLSASGGQLPETVHAAGFTHDMLPTLGVEPALGRNFTAAEDSLQSNATVILSWGLWKRRFGGNPSILNQTVLLDSKPYTVIGVMPAWFAYPDQRMQLWTPIYHENPEKLMQALDDHEFRVVGRLKPGVTPAHALAELSVITRALRSQHLDNQFVSKDANLRPLLDSLVGDVKTPLYILLAATACVLLIACLNVANLLVARSATRRKELGIRAALGGSTMRLVRQHLMESLLLSVAGGALGIAFASAALQWILATRPDMLRIDAIRMDTVVAAFAGGLIVLCALFSGLISSFSAKSGQVHDVLRESSRSHSAGVSGVRLRATLLSLEVGLTVVLLIGAGLLLKSYAKLSQTDLGCITKNVMKMDFTLPEARYTHPQCVTFFRDLLERVRATPGIQTAGLVFPVVPGDGYGGDNGFEIPGQPTVPGGKMHYALHRWSDPGYFSAIGIPLVHGRTFDDDPDSHPHEVIISQAFVREFFSGKDPVGQHLLALNKKSYEIVGVVGDTRIQAETPPQPTMYFPLDQADWLYPTDYINRASLVIRSPRDVTQSSMPMQKIFQQMDRDLPVSDILTMDQVIGRGNLDASFDATLLLIFAGLSLVLAAVGLFGVLSYIVAQRTAEIGIRIALGAQRGQVLRKVMVDGLRPALLGLACGLAASMVAARQIASMLYGTKPLDPTVFAAVSCVLLLVAALACLVPAWRASRLDPMQALRTE